MFIPNEGVLTPNHKTRWWPLFGEPITTGKNKGKVKMQRYDYTTDKCGGDHASWVLTTAELAANYTQYPKNIIISGWLNAMRENENPIHGQVFYDRDNQGCGWDVYYYEINGHNVWCAFEDSKMYGLHLRQWMIDGHCYSKHVFEMEGLTGKPISYDCTNGLMSPTIEKQCMVYDGFIKELNLPDPEAFFNPKMRMYWIHPSDITEYLTTGKVTHY